jgi:anti-sigma factor RsiW
MADGIEHIESRLAAYIEGELPDADRAEIEKYLVANPSHRQLIDELKRQKGVIASLPRESAPVEILDHLQSHLERQALLDNVEDGADSMRINRWPQWTAVAAMLLLTVGLGALVFSVLPGGALNHETVAIAPPSMQNLPTAPSLDPKETAGDNRAGNGVEDAIESRDAVASTAAGRDTERFMGKAGPDRARSADRLDKPSSDADKLNEAMVLNPSAESSKAAGGAKLEQDSLVLTNGNAIVVSTDDPLITQNLLAGYLGQNNYEYTPVRADVAQASVAAARSFSNADSVGQTQQQALQTQTDSSQQDLGSIVQRVTEKEKIAPNGEQFLVVRNLSPADAERINRTINSQRGQRQQARLYSNPELYPELAGQQQQYAANQTQLKQQQQPFDQPNQQTRAPAGIESKDNQPADLDLHAKAAPRRESEVPPNPAGADFGDTPAAGSPAPGEAQQGQTEPTQQANTPTTVPAEEQAMRMDVLIVVRNAPATTVPGDAPDATTDPTADDASTQPSTNPATLPTTLPDEIPLNIAPPILLTPVPNADRDAPDPGAPDFTAPTTQPAR